MLSPHTDTIKRKLQCSEEPEVRPCDAANASQGNFLCLTSLTHREPQSSGGSNHSSTPTGSSPIPKPLQLHPCSWCCQPGPVCPAVGILSLLDLQIASATQQPMSLSCQHGLLEANQQIALNHVMHKQNYDDAPKTMSDDHSHQNCTAHDAHIIRTCPRM